MEAKVVTDAGPLLVLAKLNLLHLLKDLYGEVIIPRAVFAETVLQGLREGFEDAKTLQRFLEQERWQATEVPYIPDFLVSSHLDRGELESLALAMALNALLLMDEELGREVARRHGVKVRGTLGILIQAYRAGLISADQLRFYFGQIEERTDIWINPKLCQLLLKEVLP